MPRSASNSSIDAAHATTPWQGAGAGMAIEDALILEVLLGNVRHISELERAFAVYDKLRRPRTQQVISTSREIGLAFCGRHPHIGFDRVLLEKELPSKWDFIYDLDMESHAEMALRMFRDD